MTGIEIYSDGSGQTSNTAGGFGWVLVLDGVKHSEGSGYSEKATNNDMELEGAIQGLAAALKYVNDNKNNCQFTESTPEAITYNVTLVSDSQIVLGWAAGTYKFKQQSKIEKYNQLKFLVKRLYVKTRWVKGHSGDEHNERCDKLANNARKGIATKELDKPIPVGDTNIGTKKAGIFCVWFGDVLKIVDFDCNIVENYNREVHGKRGSAIQIREEKDR